jgi:hypothetical protein
MSKKEGLLFIDNILFFVVYDTEQPIGFFGLRLYKKKALIKCDYVKKENRGNRLLTKMIHYRLRWLKENRPEIKKISLTTTPMATNSHLRCGAKIVKVFKNQVTQLEYEIL